jgi:hypothetical protein
MTRDHYIPRSRGGGTDWDNIVLACARCNESRGNAMPVACVSCGRPARLRNEDGEYCVDCMKLHLVEKMFVQLNSLAPEQAKQEQMKL